MEREVLGAEYDKVISTYYGEEQVIAVVTLKVDTKEADKIATELAEIEPIEDVFLVFGDTDIILKAKFMNYKEVKDFVVNQIGKIEGVRETKTFMVVTTYKERGVKKEE